MLRLLIISPWLDTIITRTYGKPFNIFPCVSTDMMSLKDNKRFELAGNISLISSGNQMTLREINRLNLRGIINNHKQRWLNY